jgi:hypothetical protein
MTHKKHIAGAFLLGLALAAALFVNDTRRTEFQVTWHPGESSTFVDPLYPTGRWEKPEHGAQAMMAEPGYTDIRQMRKYQSMSLAVSFENPDNIPVEMGMRGMDDGMNLSPANSGRYEATFPVNALRDKDGRAQLIISAPKLRDGARPIAITGITVTYHK